MSLEDEARDFKKRAGMTEKEKTAMRYYLGCVLTGMIARGENLRQEDIDNLLNQAMLLAKAAVDKEAEF